MYGILGEDRSDANTLTVLVRRLAADSSLPVERHGLGGGGELLRKGVKHLKLLAELGCTRFVIRHDADGPDPSIYRDRVRNEIVHPAGLEPASCILIPVQELEAWILADIAAVTKVFNSWHPKPFDNPEKQVSPKEYLVRLSRHDKGRPRYDPVVHNEKLAKHLNLKMVERKCPSFKPLVTFVGQA